MDNKKVVVLVSGGLDSAVCLALAVKDYGAKSVLALSMYYGQKHKKELEYSNKLTEYYKVDHMVHEISSVFDHSDCTLLAGRAEIEHSDYAEQVAKANGKPVATYVPFRNGLFLAHAAAIAISVGAQYVMYGAHADDAAGNAYPDCSQDFVADMDAAIYEGSGKTCRLSAPLAGMHKTGVVALGMSLNVPFELTWSCYEGGDKPCGKCGTCIDRAKAFAANGIADPALFIDITYKGE